MATYDVGPTGVWVTGPGRAIDGIVSGNGTMPAGVGMPGVMVSSGYGFASSGWEGWKSPNTTGQLWPRGGRGNGFFTS